mgnify:CR=1 FL=1
MGFFGVFGGFSLLNHGSKTQKASIFDFGRGDKAFLVIFGHFWVFLVIFGGFVVVGGGVGGGGGGVVGGVGTAPPAKLDQEAYAAGFSHPNWPHCANAKWRKRLYLQSI